MAMGKSDLKLIKSLFTNDEQQNSRALGTSASSKVILLIYDYIFS